MLIVRETVSSKEKHNVVDRDVRESIRSPEATKSIQSSFSSLSAKTRRGESLDQARINADVELRSNISLVLKEAIRYSSSSSFLSDLSSPTKRRFRV